MYVCIHPARRKQINVDQLLGYAKREREREREFSRFALFFLNR